MPQDSVQNFSLFKAGLASEEYISAIKEDEQSRTLFLKELKRHTFSCREMLDLVQLVTDKTVQSLLIIHFLSTPFYLNQLSEDSILTRIQGAKEHKPSRLNGLVCLLDTSLLTPSVIVNLDPEAAISILYSLPHFHKITRNQVEELLSRYPEPQVIAYWLKHLSVMPHAEFMLAHFLGAAEAQVSFELRKNSTPAQRESIRVLMIKHLELFKPNAKILQAPNEEDYLALSIKLFLHGHKSKVYMDYINSVTTKLLEKNHSFSPQTIQQFIALRGAPEFQELSKKTDYWTNYHLRKNAQDGTIDVFYDEGAVVISSMLQPIPLHIEMLQKNKETASDHAHEEHPIILEMAKREITLSSFDYFLIHYEGDFRSLCTAIDDYLSFYAKEKPGSLSVQHLSMLLNKSKINSVVKEALFTSLLNYPQLYNEQTAFHLFQYDAKKILQHFGMQGGAIQYNRVINLCTWALNKLDPVKHIKIIEMAQKAKTEAAIELSFGTSTNIFIVFFNFIRRCWTYGWTGFFNPNLPVYVAPAYTVLDTVEPEPAQEKASGRAMKNTLINLIKDLKSPYAQSSLTAITDSLKLYSLKNKPKDELDLRNKVHELFHQILFEKKSNAAVAEWLSDHEDIFIKNRIRIIEILMEEDLLCDEELLFSPVDEDNPLLQQVKNEFCCPIPIPQLELSTIPNQPALETSIEDAIDAAIDRTADLTSKLVSGTLSSLNSVSTFFSANNFIPKLKDNLIHNTHTATSHN